MVWLKSTSCLGGTYRWAEQADKTDTQSTAMAVPEATKLLDIVQASPVFLIGPKINLILAVYPLLGAPGAGSRKYGHYASLASVWIHK
jgi:hypothetical protein